jgi:hypothetical protein
MGKLRECVQSILAVLLIWVLLPLPWYLLYVVVTK